MSVEQNIFMTREKMPSPKQWQKAIRDAGLPLTIDTAFNVDEFEGFLPCKLDGEEAGFEYFSEIVALSDLVDEEMLDEQEASELDDRTFLVTLSSRSSYVDARCAVLAAGVLCSISGGRWADSGEPPFILPDKAGEYARKACEELVEAERRDAEMEVAREQALSAGNLEEQLGQVLQSVAGKEVESMVTAMGSLGFLLKDSVLMMAGTWSVTTVGGKQFNNGRYQNLRQKQMEVFQRCGPEPGDSELAVLSQLDEALEPAEEQDERDTESVMDEIRSWPETISIESAIFEEDKRILVVRLAEVPGASVVFRPAGLMGDVKVRSAQGLSYSIGLEKVDLS